MEDQIVIPPEDSSTAADLAREIMDDSAKVLHNPNPSTSKGQPPLNPGAGPEDAYGRPFDPDLHLRRGDGTPATHPRTGRLVCLPGKQLTRRTKSRVEPTAPAATGNLLDLGLDVDGQADAVGGDAGGSTGIPYDAVEAQSGAELITDFSELIARWLAGDNAEPTAKERTTRQHRWTRWMQANQLSIPFVLFGQAIVGEGKYLSRVWALPAAKAKLAKSWRTLWGQPEPVLRSDQVEPAAATAGVQDSVLSTVNAVDPKLTAEQLSNI